MAQEGVLRRKLRDSWCSGLHGELVWVEAAHGGTVGAPDVFVPVGMKRGYLPLELKWWKAYDDLIEFSVRPSQLRFHRLAYEAGQRTAFLALLSDERIVLMAGSKLGARDIHGLINISMMRVLPRIEDLRDALCDEKLWRGKVK